MNAGDIYDQFKADGIPVIKDSVRVQQNGTWSAEYTRELTQAETESLVTLPYRVAETARKAAIDEQRDIRIDAAMGDVRAKMLRMAAAEDILAKFVLEGAISNDDRAVLQTGRDDYAAVKAIYVKAEQMKADPSLTWES